MAEMTLDQILQAASKLPPDKQQELIARLQTRSADQELRERLAAGFQQRKATGAFDDLESLQGKFAQPAPPADADEMNAYLRGLSREWEEDLDHPTN